MSATPARAAAKTRKLFKLLANRRYRRALLKGVAAAVELDDLECDPRLQTVVDVGANRGQFALLARERFPNAELICFEPLPQARERLNAVLPLLGRISVVPCAAADESGRRAFHVSAREDSSSLLPIGAGQVAAYPGTQEESQTEIDVVTLAEALRERVFLRPALLKVDTQGSEFEVLRGAGAFLGAFDHLVLELSFQELYVGQAPASQVIQFLLDRGWRIAGILGRTWTESGGTVQADFLFRPGPSVSGQLGENAQ